MKKIIAAVFAAFILFGSVAGCASKADVASKNLSVAADNFEIQRQIVFYNGITGQYIAEVVGKCSLGNFDGPGKVSVTCKTGPNSYIKNYLGLSDNVTYFALQTKAAHVSSYRYRIIWRPSTIVPAPQLDMGGTQ